jgi:hypothetical protein
VHCIPTFCVSLPSFSFKVVVDGCMQHTNSFYFWSLMCFHHPRVGCNDYHCDYLIIDFVIANMIRVLNTVLYWVRQFCTPCPRFLHNVCNDNFVFTLYLNVFLLGLVMENLIMLVIHAHVWVQVCKAYYICKNVMHAQTWRENQSRSMPTWPNFTFKKN